MNKLGRLFKNYLKPQWKWILLALMAAQVSSTSSFTLGFLSMTMVDHVLQIRTSGEEIISGGIPSDERFKRGTDRTRRTIRDDRARPGAVRGERPPAMRAQAEKLYLVKWIFISFIFVRIFFAFLQWGYSATIAKVGEDLVYNLRKQVYDKLQKLQLSYFDRQDTGKIMARVMDDVDVVQSSVSDVFISLVSNITMLLIGTLILLNINADMSFVAFCTLPFYAITYRIFKSRIRAVNKAVRERNADVYGAISDNLNGVRVVKAFAREGQETLRFFSKLSNYLRTLNRRAVLGTFLGTLCGLISGIGTTVVVYLGIVAMREGAMTLGNFLFFYGSMGLLFRPIVALSDMNVSIQVVMTALTRVFEVLDEEIRIEDPEEGIDMEEVYGEVIFRHVTLRYEGAPDDTLRDVSFAVMPGSMVCVVGESGAGKSSLVNLLPRLYDPTEGRITLDGEDIRDINLESLRNHVRVVPQEPILFSGTMDSNIRYGLPKASHQDVEEASKQAELHDFISSLPKTYETEIGEEGVSLSGGQKQRMSMAMTMITNPSVLILDDTTSALDAETEGRVRRTVERMALHRTTFVVTQKVAMCREADLILVLKAGRLVEQGTYDKLVLERGAFYELFESQIRFLDLKSPPEEAKRQKRIVAA